MAQRESRKDQVARQLQALMTRHGVTAQELDRRTGVSYVTINRILRSNAKTEPEPATLIKLAKAVGEMLEQAFPLPGDEAALTVEVDGRKLAFKSLDGGPVDLELMRRAVELHSSERSLTKPRRKRRNDKLK